MRRRWLLPRRNREGIWIWVVAPRRGGSRGTPPRSHVAQSIHLEARSERERDREGGTTGAMGGWPVHSFGMIPLRHGRNEKPPSMTH